MTKEEMEARRKNMARIKGMIVANELTHVAIEKRFKLYSGCVYDAIRKPHEDGEAAIAEALGVQASDLWPERYDSITGLRLSPQPYENYHMPPSRRSSQKMMEAQR